MVNPGAPFLGASPDGHLVDPTEEDNENGVLEIKCPSTWENLEHGLSSPNGYLLLCEKSGKFILNPAHNYYCQVQGQMLVCGVQWCDFTIFIKNTNDLHVQRIYLDIEFCKQLYNRLNSLYFEFALPFLNNANKENIK